MQTLRQKNQQGFTLVEMIIYIAILAVVVGGFISFAFSVTDSSSKNYVVTEVQANARVAFNLIRQKILAANGLNISASTFGADPGVLSLSMADSSKNPTVINLNTDDGQLQIQEGFGSPIIVTSDEVQITNLVFTDLTTTSERENIRIQLTAEFNNGGGDTNFNYKQDFQTAVSLRQ